MLAVTAARRLAGSCVIAFAVALLGVVAGEAIAKSNPEPAIAAASPAADSSAAASPAAVSPNDTTGSEPQALSAAIEPVALIPGGDRAAADSPPPIVLAAIEPADRGIDQAALTASPLMRGREPFGRSTEIAAEGPVWSKWRALEADIAADREVLARCRAATDDCPDAAQRFLAIIDDAHARSGRARLGEVNRAVNLAIRPMSDLAQWGVLDRWSAPLETFTSQAGDCEDYAIAKYVALREAGVADEDLRLVIVRHRPTSEDHAVLAARVDGHWLLLDNRTLVMLEDNEATTFEPLFVLDHGGVQRVANEPPPARQARHGIAAARM
jgi:predicted transglutaminase-like cysteine proteinase